MSSQAFLNGDPHGIAARLQAFDDRHGGRKSAVIIGHGIGYLLFPDGARRDGDPLGPMIEPPEEAYELAQLKVLYRKVLYDRAVTAFDEWKQTLIWRANAIERYGDHLTVPITSQDEDKLEDLQQVVHNQERKLKAALKHEEESKPARMVREEQSMAEARRQGTEALSRLKDIRV